MDVFGRAAQDRFIAAHDDRSLDEVGILDHDFYQLVVRQLSVFELEVAVSLLAFPQQIARAYAELFNQVAKLGGGEPLLVIVDPFELRVVLFEKTYGLSALASGRLLINFDLIFHRLTSSRF